MASVLSKILLLIIIFFIAASLGRKLLSKLGISLENKLELFVFSSALGFALITEYLLFLGLIKCFTPLFICLFPLLFFVFCAREARFFLTDFFTFISGCNYKFPFSWILLAAFMVFIIINIFKALLPPHGPTDVLYYHLTLPKLFLDHNSLVSNPTFFPSFFPSNGELIFSLALVLGGPVMVNLINFGFALLTVIALYVYTQKYFVRELALIPGIFYLTCPVVNSWGTMAYPDNILGFYLFLLVMHFGEISEKFNGKKAVLGGIFTGMILGIKYQAIFLTTLIYFFFFISKRGRKVAVWLAISLSIGIVIASPWFIRNYILTQNPFFPIFNDFFPSPLLRKGSWWEINTQGSKVFLSAFIKLKENYFFPFNYLWTGAWGKGGDFQRYLGPLFLFFSPLFIIYKNRLKWQLLVLICLLSYGFFLFLGGNLRYVVLLIILLSLAGGAVVQKIALFNRMSSYLMIGFFVFVLSFFSFQNYQLMLSHKRILTTFNPKLTPYFLRAVERSYYPAEWANKNLPDDAKVLFHGFHRYFYFKFEPFNDHLNQTLISYDKAKNGEDILMILSRLGFTHLIALDKIPESYRPDNIVYEEDYRFKDFYQKYLVKIFSANGISIFRIKGQPIEGQPSVETRQYFH